MLIVSEPSVHLLFSKKCCQTCSGFVMLYFCLYRDSALGSFKSFSIWVTEFFFLDMLFRAPGSISSRFFINSWRISLPFSSEFTVSKNFSRSWGLLTIDESIIKLLFANDFRSIDSIDTRCEISFCMSTVDSVSSCSAPSFFPILVNFIPIISFFLFMYVSLSEIVFVMPWSSTS